MPQERHRQPDTLACYVRREIAQQRSQPPSEAFCFGQTIMMPPPVSGI